MDENNTPSDPTPTPEPTPVPEPAPAAAAPTPPEPAVAQATAPPSAGAAGPVPFAGPPDPSIPADEKSQALICWILLILTSWVGPLIFYLITKPDKPFAKQHAAQALTIGIATIALWIVGAVTCLLGIGMVILSVMWLYPLIFGILGCLAANAGSSFDPPVTGALARSWFKV